MSRTVLIVDDSVDDEIVLRRALNFLGVINPIHVARDGREAIAFLKDEGAMTALLAPSVIFLDLKMPGVDGWEVLRWLKLQNRRDLLVVVLTGYEDRHQLTEAYQLGANSFLFKPIHVEEVLELIENWPDALMLASPMELKECPGPLANNSESTCDYSPGESQQTAV